MKTWERVVSLCAVAVIFGGLAYAYERESLSQNINTEYFDGGLSGVTVEWIHLDQDSGQARKLNEHEYVILVDRRENTSIEDVRRTLEHEACHVWVDWKEREEHGELFHKCAQRFE